MGQHVKYYHSSEFGTPTLNNVAGSGINVLDAVLVNGFNSVSVSSLIVSGGVATVTAANHQFNTNINNDPDITIAGATPSLLNGSKQVTFVDANTFTFPAPGVVDGAASGSITARRSPLGWQKMFSGTNKAIYKSSDPQAYGQMLRVDDTASNSRYMRCTGIEAATGIDAFTDPFPTVTQQSGAIRWNKGALSTTAKEWIIIGDSRFFYFLSKYESQPSYTLAAFGDLISFRPNEQYGSVIMGGLTDYTSSYTGGIQSSTFNSMPAQSSTSAIMYLCRDYSGFTKSTTTGLHPVTGLDCGEISRSFPNPVNNGLIFIDGAFVSEYNIGLQHPFRGKLPGYATVLANYAYFPGDLGFTIHSTTDGSNKKYFHIHTLQKGAATSMMFVAPLSNWRA